MPASTPWGAAGEFAASRHGALSRRQAADLGLNAPTIRRLLRDRLLFEPAPGVLVVNGTPATWRRQLTIATLCSNGVGVAGYRSAAALHGMDTYSEGPIDILLPSPRRLRVEGATLHTGPFTAQDFTVVDGIRCTSVDRTLCDIGAVDHEWKVKAAFEWAWRNGYDLGRLQRTVDRLHRPGQHGTKVVQELLVEAKVHGRPTESMLEVRLEAILGDIDGLVRQYEVFDECGQFVARVDFAIPGIRLAIEAHSRRYHFGPDAERRDAVRHERLIANAWRVRYVTNGEMGDPSKLRSTIRRLVHRT